MAELNVKNKKASFQYEFIEKYIAGIQLLGTEIKSIRDGKAALTDSYCSFSKNGELFVKMYIGEYSHGGYTNHDPRRERKLLLTKRELSKLQKKVQNTGLTIVPLKMFMIQSGWVKIEIALCRGKKMADKRHDLRDKDTARELDRARKNNL